MTMQEQELMLFGGWAKAQIPLPIESGVEKPSGMLSISIYTSTEYAGEPFEFEAFRVFHELYRVDVSGEREEYVEQGRRIDAFLEEGVSDIGVSGRYDTVVFLRPLLDLAFVRFFEVWRRGTLDDMVRGCAGKEKLREYFSNKIDMNDGTSCHLT